MKTKLIIPIVLFTLIIITFSACSQAKKIDLASEKAAILELHNAQRDYHFNKDSIAFANQLSDNFISVNKGLVSSPKRTKTISRYHDYFSSVEFLKWDDVSEPIIKFSDDGSMAYTVVDKIVTTYYKDGHGNLIEDETHFAWTTIYKKYENEWRIDCVTSTNKLVKE
jgi:hypothetical protein